MNTDEQLIQQFCQGDMKAFEDLYLRHKDPLYRYLFRQVSNKDLSDELHQDVWAKIIKQANQFNQLSSFKTWLYKIAHNHMIDYFRANKFRSQFDNKNNSETVDDEHKDNEQACETINQSPEAEIQNQQLKQEIFAAVEQLPNEQKEVFLLHEHGGFNIKSIASITNNSQEATKSRLRYAIKKLRDKLEVWL
ncbi:MAG: sigma-70 family RNA polymerase sigma factor [Gammaproteobacteria bacterium]|nr:sigma-70 family RNA polymerase sigma factor [Gammaproteobacteria bacterium]